MSRIARSCRHATLAALLVCSLLLVGCSRVKTANFNKINNQMSLEEVEGVLGPGQIMNVEDFKPTNTEGLPGGAIPTKVRVWQADNALIVVLFQNDKVIAKMSKGL